METIEKVNVAELKSEIKELAEKQSSLKNQRKTVKLVGERTMEPWLAALNHHGNRAKLRAMYAAYAILRGKDPSVIDSGKFESEYDEDRFKTSVENILIKYQKGVKDEV
jgi:hypothetical protein